jgi:tetratricopeptide (TPR) repeat protein
VGQVFVGREVELGALVRLFEEASEGHGQLGFLVGEPGIGKTRLAEEIERLAEARNARVVWGRAWEGGGTPPFWPWRQALKRLLPDGAELLERPHDPKTGEERMALYESVSDAIRRATAEMPAVIIFDDMHIADLSSLELLRFVARDLRGARVLLLVTSRELSLFASSEVSAILEKTAREAMLIPLVPLRRADLARWVELAAPALATEIDALFERSDGNPLFVRELMAIAVSAKGRKLPIGVRAAIRDHLALLGDATRTMLETLSVAGREIDRPTLAAFEATSLDEAYAKGIVVEGDNGGIRFTHVLLRDELYSNIPASRRAELHRRAWRVAPDPASALHHALEGAREEDAIELGKTATAAVKDAIVRHAFEEAASLGQRAIARTKNDAELYIATAEAFLFTNRRDDAIRLCAAAADLTQSPDVLARAALTAAHEPTMVPRPDVVRLLRRAEAALPPEDSPLRAIVLGRLARSMLPPAPHELAEYIDLRTRSIEMVRRVGSRFEVLEALRLATEGFNNLVSIEQQYAFNAEVITLAEELNRSATIVPLLPHQVAACLQLGDASGAWREVGRAEEILARLDKTPHFRWRAPLIRALMCCLEGKFEEADALQRRALELAQAAKDRHGVLMFTIQRLMLHYNRGDADGLNEFSALFAEVQSGVPLTDLFKSIEHAICGRREETRACLARFDPKIAEGIPGVATLGWPCAEAELADLAPTFIPLVEQALAQGAMQFGPAGLVTMGPMNLVLGRLYLLVDRLDEAEKALLDARALSSKLGAKPWVAIADRALATLAERRGQPPPTSKNEKKLQLTRDGAVWRLSGGGGAVVLKDTRGLAYLDELLRRPHREVHVLELTKREAGDAGPMLDAPAKAAYRDRIAELRAEMDEAASHNDPGRVERLQNELDAVTHELLRAVGLGGRDRLAGNQSELARSSVQRRLRDVIKRATEQAPALGRHLELSVKTGTFCMYAPTWPD